MKVSFERKACKARLLSGTVNEIMCVRDEAEADPCVDKNAIAFCNLIKGVFRINKGHSHNYGYQ